MHGSKRHEVVFFKASPDLNTAVTYFIPEVFIINHHYSSMEHHSAVPYKIWNFFAIFFSKFIFSCRVEQKLTIWPRAKSLHSILILENEPWKTKWNLWVDLSKYFIVKTESQNRQNHLIFEQKITFYFRKNVLKIQTEYYCISEKLTLKSMMHSCLNHPILMDLPKQWVKNDQFRTQMFDFLFQKRRFTCKNDHFRLKNHILLIIFLQKRW